MEKVLVDLGERSYPIYIGQELSAVILAEIEAIKDAKRPYCVITDNQVAASQADFLDKYFSQTPRFTFPNGETSKNLQTFSDALEFMATQGLDRSTCVFAFGGGVVGDLAGYVAASYMRGVDFVQIPTTLLSMVDSSVGGKTGVNLRAGKNLVGAFKQPTRVIIELDRLKTLDPREFSAGMAEIIKAGLLADIALFEKLETLPRLTAESPELGSIIKYACEIKASVVKADETESAASGGRALLNLGHTFGHAIEQVTAYQKYLHGEAISIGMIMAALLSNKLANIQEAEVIRIARVFEKYELPTKLEKPLESAALIQAMSRDKKKKQGVMKFVVLEKLGQAKTQADIKKPLIEKVLTEAGAC